MKTPEPRVSRFVVFLTRFLGRIYLFLFYGVARIVLRDEDRLFDAFKRAMAGKSRCIIAFRHPNGGEPQILTWFFLFRLKAVAARKGIRFARWPHAVSVYGYELVRWGGWVVRFIMPNLGAMPVHHAKMDKEGMARIYKAITEGPYPLSLSPEGQVSYTTEAVPRLEQGTIRIGFNAAERLAAKEAGSAADPQADDCPLEILPVSIYFRFGSWGRINIEVLLKRIEKLCGLFHRGRKNVPFTERLRQCREHILEVNEARYQIKPAANGGADNTADSAANSATPLSFEQRLDRVINAALETAERMIGVKSEGEFFSRLYRVRQFCWDRIYLPEVDNLDGMTPVMRNVKDLCAGEAWYIGRHQELVDFCWYFRVPLPTEETAFHNKIEYVQNLWDFASRTMGGAYSDRVNIFPRKVIIHAAPPINLTERLPAYKKDRKAAIAAAMSDLEKAYLDTIKEANSAERERS